MGFLQDQNRTVGVSQPEVTQWESAADRSSAVNNTIVVLGVLTFALQLCLVLFFTLRCWRLDNRVRAALKRSEAFKTLAAPSSLHPDIYKQAPDDAAAASPPSTPAPLELYEPVTTPNTLFGPSVPWDLVQR